MTNGDVSLDIRHRHISTAAGDIVARFRTTVVKAPWDESLTFAVRVPVSDLEDGTAVRTLDIGDDYLVFDAEVDLVTVPIGPLDVNGTVEVVASDARPRAG